MRRAMCHGVVYRSFVRRFGNTKHLPISQNRDFVRCHQSAYTHSPLVRLYVLFIPATEGHGRLRKEAPLRAEVGQSTFSISAPCTSANRYSMITACPFIPNTWTNLIRSHCSTRSSATIPGHLRSRKSRSRTGWPDDAPILDAGGIQTVGQTLFHTR